MEVQLPKLVVRDGIVPELIIDQCLEETPPLGDQQWVHADWASFFELAETHVTMRFMDEAITSTVSKFYTEPKTDFSEGGIYQMTPGQFLRPHREHNNIKGNRRFRRRVGIIVFLNDPDGGSFQLWDETGPVNTIDALRGRIVFYDINSYHSVTPVGPDSRRLTLELHLASLVTEQPEDVAYNRTTMFEEDHPEVFLPQ